MSLCSLLEPQTNGQASTALVSGPMRQSIALPCCLPFTCLPLVSVIVQSQCKTGHGIWKGLGSSKSYVDFSLVHCVATALPFSAVRVRYTGQYGNSLHSNAGFLRKSPFSHVTAIALGVLLWNFPSLRNRIH